MTPRNLTSSKLSCLLALLLVTLCTSIPVKAHGQSCGQGVMNVPVQCGSPTCSSSTILQIPYGQRLEQYYYSPITCCGTVYPNYGAGGVACYTGSLRDPGTLQNLGARCPQMIS
jgi:hypothetical protein